MESAVNLGPMLPRWRALRAAEGLQLDSDLALVLLDAYEKGRLASTPPKKSGCGVLPPEAWNTDEVPSCDGLGAATDTKTDRPPAAAAADQTIHELPENLGAAAEEKRPLDEVVLPADPHTLLMEGDMKALWMQRRCEAVQRIQGEDVVVSALPSDVRKVIVGEEEQQECSSSLDQEDPEPPHIKEEQEELWSSQEGEQLQGLEEADITKFTFTPVPVKSEDDEEKPQSSQMETEADGEDCGGPGPDRNSHPDTHVTPETEDKTGDSSERQSGLNSVKDDEVPVGDSRCSAGEKPFSCSECGKSFGASWNLKRHMRSHTGEKPFSCSVCQKYFTENGNLQSHMRIHTGEKVSSCSVCGKSFTESGSLKKHMRTHTGEKPFPCSFCKKCFAQSAHLHKHMRVHTGEKPFSCSVCNKRFAWRPQLKKHQCFVESSQFHQSQTEENREVEPPASSSTEQMETEADGEDCGGPGPDRNSHPDTHVTPETEDKTGDSSEPETDDSDKSVFWKESSGHVSGLKSLKQDEVSQSDETFKNNHLKIHRRNCTGEEHFPEAGSLSQHVVVHREVKQEHPEPPHIKEEQEELWSSQEGEQLQGLEEADIIKFTFTPVPVKSEDDEEKPQSSQMETEADGEDCGGPGPGPGPDLQPVSEDNSVDSSETETADSDDDWTETREPQSGSNSVKDKEVPVSDLSCSAGEKPYSCPECGKGFDARGYVKKHMLIHTGEKPYSCTVCGKRFLHKAYLKEHTMTHTGERPFSCSECGKRFLRKDKLVQHTKTHLQEKPFSCSKCEKVFGLESSLKRHMRIHIEENPISCSVCKKSFAQNGHLQTHMRIHTGEKPFSCSVCNKRFSRKRGLRHHMSVHTGEKPFSCSVCNKRFAWPRQVRYHKCVESSQSSQSSQPQTQSEPPASSSSEHITLLPYYIAFI